MRTATQQPGTAKRTLLICSGAHAIHDGFTDLLNVLYPLLQSQFGLSYAAIGTLKAVYSTAMAGGQIPAGRLADRWGGAMLLALGTVLAAIGYMTAGFAGSVGGLIIGLILAGAGGATQHPIASSLIATAYAGANSRSALGTYNFAGDIGKVVVPSAFALIAAGIGWQGALIWIGAAGVVSAAFIVALPSSSAAGKGQVAGTHSGGDDTPWAFRVLLSVHIMDNLIRTGVMVLLPFVLRESGADLPAIGLGLSLLFAGGAAGKLVFGWLGQRIGVVPTVLFTQAVTAATVATASLLPISVAAWPVVLVLLGLTLNGTSSVLYGTVPEFVSAKRRTHAFAVFYTGGSAAGAVGPIAFGVVADVAGLASALICVALIGLAAMPLVLSLRRAL